MLMIPYFLMLMHLPEHDTQANSTDTQAAGVSQNRRDFLKALSSGLGAALVATSGCDANNYTDAQLQYMQATAELNTALQVSGLFVEHRLPNWDAEPSCVKLRETQETCARFAIQADSTYIIYFASGSEHKNTLSGDPGRKFNPAFETAKIFSTVEDTAEFLRNSFGTQGPDGVPKE